MGEWKEEKDKEKKGRIDERTKERPWGSTEGREEARPIFRLPRNGRCLLAVARRRYITNIYQRESPSGTEATASSCPFPFSLFSLSLSPSLSPFYAFVFRTKPRSHPGKPKLRAFPSVASLSLSLSPSPFDFLSKKERKNAYTCDRVRAVLGRSNIRATVDEHRDKTLRAKSRRPFSVTARRDHGKIAGRCPEPRSFTLPDPYASALWSFSAKPAPRGTVT